MNDKWYPIWMGLLISIIVFFGTFAGIYIEKNMNRRTVAAFLILVCLIVTTAIFVVFYN
ncbi:MULTISPECIES: hypothetical protein [unclassified Paenibacillus]|uniref:hypothetical protein n=1 Tax=unclassified Paenibacillus TaxID=185978 RepID=UPI00020D7844|nr:MULTISPECIES: hypothetical protein [unclassified Paenibacillus]EGL19852.1 hypothetical protein HMPREF9413_4807 [Paenibacillus sp. HGF7]EPD81337.1 hypothetical protein HMPREF1207_05095 [Paenibacillus sp. HGH0039]